MVTTRSQWRAQTAQVLPATIENDGHDVSKQDHDAATVEQKRTTAAMAQKESPTSMRQETLFTLWSTSRITKRTSTRISGNKEESVQEQHETIIESDVKIQHAETREAKHSDIKHDIVERTETSIHDLRFWNAEKCMEHKPKVDNSSDHNAESSSDEVHDLRFRNAEKYRGSEPKSDNDSKHNAELFSDNFHDLHFRNAEKLKRSEPKFDDDSEHNAELFSNDFYNLRSRNAEKSRRSELRLNNDGDHKAELHSDDFHDANNQATTNIVTHAEIRERKRLIVSFKYKRSLVITLRLQPNRLITLKYRRVRGRYALIPFSYRTNNRKFRFGHNPFWHRGSQWPLPTACQDVFDRLANFHRATEGFEAPLTADVAPLSMDVELERPTHAQIGISVDSIIKVIFSQSTANPTAIRQHNELCKTFTYDVDGEKVRGKIPNYHKIRLLSQEELEGHLRIGGLFKIRAESILYILNTVHATNCERLGIDPKQPTVNQPGATDFVPGLLSLDYLNDMPKEQLMDYLIAWKNVGVKTAACILAFNFRMPVFAVDIHVHHMCRQLGWIPADCDSADQACMFLDKFIPNDLKYGLHQIFWHHRQACLRCKHVATDKRKPSAWTAAQCPLESLCNRDITPLIKRNAKRRIDDVEVDDEHVDQNQDETNVTTIVKVDQDSVINADTIPQGTTPPKPTTRQAKRSNNKRLKLTTPTKNSNKETTPKEKKTTKSLSTMTPLQAAKKGYVLITEQHDNDFGVSGRTTTSLAWKLDEFAEDNERIGYEEAVDRGYIREGIWGKKG